MSLIRKSRILIPKLSFREVWKEYFFERIKYILNKQGSMVINGQLFSVFTYWNILGLWCLNTTFNILYVHMSKKVIKKNFGQELEKVCLKK